MRAVTRAIVFALAVLAGLESRGEALASGPAIGTANLPTQTLVGVSTSFSVTATGVGLSYQWSFGDGTTTSFSETAATISHTYASVGHRTVSVTVEDFTGATASQSQGITVHFPITPVQPTKSSTILLDSGRHRVWCVNPDQNTVAAVDTLSQTLVLEIPVGQDPRTLAQAADGTIWVLSQQHPSISVLDPATGALLHVVPLPHGSLPYGICMTPDGTGAYVSYQGLGGVSLISTSSRAVLATSTEPPSARGIAVTADGRVFVMRFISPQSDSLIEYNSAAFISGNHGEVWEFTSSLALVRTVNLVFDPGVSGIDPDLGNNPAPTAFGSRGVPNYLTGMVVSPDGRRLWAPSKKDDLQRGTGPKRDGLTPGAEVTYRAIISSIDLTSETKTTDELAERVDFKNSEMPQAACISPLGDYIFVALQGNNLIQVRDLYNMAGPSSAINAFGDATGTGVVTPPAPQTNGLAPQGIILDPATNKLYVQNFMGRSVSIFDATAVLNSGGGVATLGTPTVVGTVTGGDAADLLGANALLGKRVFYNASDVRMSFQSYISCAGCHLDGGSDMRVWDFTNRGEGFRNTIMLQGRGDGAGGMKHGNVHWSANFDEIQDFDNDIFNHFGGQGFPQSIAPNAPMSPPNPTNVGRDANLDALAAYVTSLSKVSRSPYRNADGSLTASGARGEEVFVALNCATCHSGREFTDSSIFHLAPPAVGPSVHNVGTLKPTSGDRLGMTLVGIDTPTLKGIWQTPPYFHDGSAAGLMDVIAASGPQHGSMNTLSAQQQADLAEYLREIDEIEPADVLSTAAAPTVSIASVDTGRPYSLATASTGSLAFVDRSYTISALSGNVTGKILLRPAEDDKLVATSSHLVITLASNATFYVYYDSRATGQPAWLDGTWTASPGDNLMLTPGGLVMKAFTKTFAAGTVTLGGNQQGGTTGALRNYFVIISQTAPIFQEGPISQVEWVHDRDADGDGLIDEYEAVKASSPWIVASVTAGVSDEDQIVSGSVTAFQDQLAFEATPPPASGGGGGCGFLGMELLPLVLLLRCRRGKHLRR